MSPPLLGVGEEEEEQNVTMLASSASMESSCQNSSALKVRNYMCLSDCSSVDSSTISTASEDNNVSLNLKATELRLGLPGSQSPERDSGVCFLSSAILGEKPLFPLHPLKDNNYLLTQKTVILGNKRGFSDAMDGFSEGKYLASMDVNLVPSARPSANMGVKPGTVKNITATPSANIKDAVLQNVVPEMPNLANENSSNCIGATNNNSSAPATKAQFVGWPPIRSFRKNTLAPTSKNSNEVDGKTGVGPLFVKVSMDGAPYLRKVDLRTYSAYPELSSALEKMFKCFTIGQYGVSGREMLCENKLKDLLHGSEYVLAYKDKDGDWMLVGDVPWEMFTETCKRLRIMKSSDAIGLAPRAVEKCRNRN